MENEKKQDTKKMNPESYIGIGLAIGVAVGAAIDNVGLGIALGLVFGAAMSEKNKSKEENSDD